MVFWEFHGPACKPTLTGLLALGAGKEDVLKPKKFIEKCSLKKDIHGSKASVGWEQGEQP